LKTGMTGVSIAVLHEKSKYLSNKFGWSQKDLQSKVSSTPGILSITSSRLEANLQILQSLGFSEEVVAKMALQRPQLMNANWTTQLRRDKWHFLANVMHVDHSTIADQPNVLEPSLADKIVPRWDFLCLPVLAKRHNASNVEQPATLLLMT